MRIANFWKNKALHLSKYAREEYNEGRALLATLGSAGIMTFADDLENIVNALDFIGDKFLSKLIKNKDWMFPCGKTIPPSKCVKEI